MRKLLTMLGASLLAAMLFLSQGAAQAEDGVFSEAELDQMMAPIALYPDSLLAQILMASTYPADVAEAVNWSKDNSDQEGDAAVEAVQDRSWDPSVMSLVAFPQVLTMMGEQPDWVQNVGDAFLASPETVMDTVQKLRDKAHDEGNLETTEQQTVIIEQPSSTETIYIIEPADPQVVYVPVYDPVVIYGSWWWPRYRPWYYYPAGYYGFGSGVIRGIGFGIGVGVAHSLWGDCRWGRGHGDIDININRYNSINRNRIGGNNRKAKWKHNPDKRRGVPYRDDNSRKKYADKRGGAEERKDFRGRDTRRDKARATLEKRAVDPEAGRKQLQGSGGDRARDSVKQANRDIARGNPGNRDIAKNVNRDQARSTLQSRDAGKTRDAGKSQGFTSKKTTSRDHALKGSGNAKQSRQNINRGTSSRSSMRSRSGGGRSSGGGGRR